MNTAPLKRKQFIGYFSLRREEVLSMGCFPRQPWKEAYFLFRKAEFLAKDCLTLAKWIESYEEDWPEWLVLPYHEQLLSRAPPDFIHCHLEKEVCLPNKSSKTMCFRRY